MGTMRLLLSGLLAAITAFGATPVYGYRVVHVYSHDRTAFTQGLEYRDGFLYEGTGLNGRSSLIVELTWETYRGFVYDRNTFQLIRDFEYPGKGWGLANDGRQIYMSDGTAQIRCWYPMTIGRSAESMYTMDRCGSNR
jgi:glutamine cyclotransferase